MKPSNKDILNAALEHGNWAFRQGYEAALQGILLENIQDLSKMPEAMYRIEAYQKLTEAINKSR
jgi:hypothetical protein